jgi:diadenylate cyclase
MDDFGTLREVLGQLGFSAIIDIMIIAIVVFAIFRVLRGTRAVTLMRGVLVLVLILFVLSRLFNLLIVSFVLENGLFALVIAAAIVFQSEIRRGLDRLGRTSLRELLFRQPTSVSAGIIASVASKLAHSRHGALIVIVNETGLQDVIETGVRLDARLTVELLESIFYPNSSLHDMATLVQGNQVIAASCELPLAQSNNVNYSLRNLGTRHRAAIGITEQTDAVSIVVSEETGLISLARGGRLERVAGEAALRDKLNEQLTKPIQEIVGSSETFVSNPTQE